MREKRPPCIGPWNCGFVDDAVQGQNKKYTLVCLGRLPPLGHHCDCISWEVVAMWGIPPNEAQTCIVADA